MTTIRMPRSLRALAGAALLLAACESPTEPPTVASVAGEYTATQFDVTTADEVIHPLRSGGELDLTLRADGTTAGRLFLPGMDEDGGDMDADLAGSWTLRGDTVRLRHDADTFLRDVDFIAQGRRLEATHAFGDARVRLTLRK
ncbi:MAG TPA: hypothetical protein VHG51_11265 [Longimicrobiaceae bacterium]|nr:hypothetical protein [Longimicrobiaceae bacterium]